MKVLLFACKRAIYNVTFVALLVAYAAVITVCSFADAAVSDPPAGVYCADSGAVAQRIVSYLADNGFVVIDDPLQLEKQVESGELDCGAVLPHDLALRIEKGDTAGCVRFVTGPMSFLPDLYRSHVSAAVYRECAPYIAAQALPDLPGEELLQEYERLFAGGYVFSFEIVGHEGAALQETRGDALLKGAASLLLFALLMGIGVDGVGRDLLLRLGAKRALFAVILPGVAVRGVLAFMAGSIGLGLADATELLAPLAVYILLLSAVGILLAALLPAQRDRYVLLVLVLIASLALCPVFADLAMFSPLLRIVRCVLPPYWFYLAEEHLIQCLGGGCGGVALSCGVLYMRWHLKERLVIIHEKM